jgi:hypothetical protein
VIGSEVDAGYSKVLFQCVPDGTKDEHKIAELD